MRARIARLGQVLSLILVSLIPCERVLAEGLRAPAWRLQTPDGTTVSYPEDAQGQPSVLLFWPSWCPYSRALQPYVQDIWEDYRDRGVKLWTINIRENGDPVQTLKDRGLSFPLLLGGDDLIASYGITRTPWLVVIDADQRIVYTRPDKSPSPIDVAIAARKALNELLGHKAVAIPETFPAPYDLHLKKPQPGQSRAAARSFPASEWVPWVDALLAELDPQARHPGSAARGPVKSGKQALRLARSLWTEAFGEARVRDMAPFQAYQRSGYWVVLGQGAELPLGAGLRAIIEVDSGAVLRVSQGNPGR